MRVSQIQIPVDELPTDWFNIVPSLPEPLPRPKDPDEGPSRLDLLPKIFLASMLKQESSQQPLVSIPEDVRELLIQAGRPRPLYRAYRLEQRLGVGRDVHLYYKREDLSPTGSHKVNTALAQVHYASKEGKKRVATETGAGQWGSALAYAASLLGLECTVYWVRHAMKMKPQRLTLMKLYGADVAASPSSRTECGRRLCSGKEDHPGSLGIAISEAIEDTLRSEDAVYCLGSVLNHVLMHQTIIGLETMKQFELVDDYPTLMIACLGGGSNFGGFTLPFIAERLKGKNETRFLAAQSEAAPNLIRGEYRYDFGDYAEHTPLMKMYTLGHKVEMHPIYADGLRYHAAAPVISILRSMGVVEATAFPMTEREIFEAARLFTQAEGFLPAPESAYAVKAAIDEARRLKREGGEGTIAFNISGHGFLDLASYEKVLFNSG
ncbi:MAG: TrpB-like pyridoxal phosphate-dependent enzyme [Aigarchaeota archaeon]|nr:TrpB-like pyridoxal phosphate-dependent enzyme [Aigarchaeota archaeon]